MESLWKLFNNFKEKKIDVHMEKATQKSGVQMHNQEKNVNSNR